MRKTIALLIAAVILAGCAQFQRNKIVFRHVTGDVWIRSIASDNHEPTEGGTDISVNTPGMQTQGIPPIAAALSGKGMFAHHNLVIEDVSGSLFIEEAGNRNQGVPTADVLQRLFKPGDPFAVTEK